MNAEKQFNATGNVYVVEAYLSLMTRESHNRVLVNEIHGIYNDNAKAIEKARDIALYWYTPGFVNEAVNDVVVRKIRINRGSFDLDHGYDVWSAAAEKILDWRHPAKH